MFDYLDKLQEQMEEISGTWNGKESGLAEDRAGAANEAIGHIKELKALLEELE